MPMFKTANFGENFPAKRQFGWIISGYCMWITSIGQKKLIQLLVPILSGILGNSHSFQKTAILSLYLSISLWHYGVLVKCRTSFLFRQFSKSDEINCHPLSVFSPPGNSPSRSAAMSCQDWTGSVVFFTGSERVTCYTNWHLLQVLHPISVSLSTPGDQTFELSLCFGFTTPWWSSCAGWKIRDRKDRWITIRDPLKPISPKQ